MAAEARRCAISSTTCSFRSLTIRPWRRSKTRRDSRSPNYPELGDRLALTTNSYVVDPLFFPGGNIGKLAVCGTINDLAVGGATPLYLTCSAIIEEGLEVDTLRALAKSMASAAAGAGVLIVTGDTKVVHRGTCDKLFLNTAGVGIIREGVNLGADRCRPGDSVLVNGLLGDHGAAILNARGDMALSTAIESDCAALHGLIAELLVAAPSTRFIRDATRGGTRHGPQRGGPSVRRRHRDFGSRDPNSCGS